LVNPKSTSNQSSKSDWDIDPYDFADEDLASLLRGDGKKKVDLVASMHMLKLKRLTTNLGKTAWNDISSLHVPDKAALGVLHSQIMVQEFRSLNSKFVSALRNNPSSSQKTVDTAIVCSFCALSCTARTLTPFCRIMKKSLTAIYGLTSHTRRMPAVKAWAAILRLATSSEGIGTGMFLADLKALINASAAPDSITAHELDARAEGVLKVCDQFTSVLDLKDFVRSCLRAETIKSVV